MAADIKDGMESNTLQYESVKFSVTDGKIKIDGANIVESDIEASNGVVHVIDAVMLPPSLESQ